jgi:hypothetical protein
MLKERPAPSFVQVSIIAAVILFIIMFAIISMNTGDILFFWPVFDGKPQRIIVHCYGEDVVVEPWLSTYEPINLAVNQSLTGTKRWDPLSMSNATYADYQTGSTMMVLELTYDPPARIHSSYKFFKNFDSLVIPLDGRHASSNSVFGRLRGYSLAGSFHVKNITTILTTLEQHGLCHIP